MAVRKPPGDGGIQPRVQFGGASALYKLYVIRPLSRPDEPPAEDPSDDFMRAFLPEVRKCLLPPV